MLPIPFNEPPHITYKHLLAKGEELTTGEVVYLLNKEVYAGKIAEVTNLTIQEVRAIGERSDRYIENHKKVVMKMGVKKHEIEEGTYNELKKQGYSDKDIADKVGMSQSTLSYHKKKWGISNPVKQPKVVSINVQQSEDYEKTMEKLKAELRKRDDLIGCLEVRISELEETVNNLHSAAEDIEKEVAASHEYIEREQELMVDANVWKQKALQYEAEYKRQTDTLKEERAEKEKYKGESLAFRMALKAVL